MDLITDIDKAAALAITIVIALKYALNPKK
ncbi:MAG: hypothetical protein RLZZ66_1855 [Pseudomonadota bacterium]|jgi:hypothetical protein